MIARMGALVLCFALFAGCGTMEERLQQQLAQAERDRDSTRQVVTDRDEYLEDVVRAVNTVYADLEAARLKEGRLLSQASDAEKLAVNASPDTREKFLQDIGEIGLVLKENRKRISDLEARSRTYRNRIAGLDTLIGNLKRTLAEREQSIAQLEGRVQGLEATVAENSRTIAEKELVIEDQQRKMSTAYYIVGTREELENKGIITDEGGFLWGLLGSTTVLASGINPTEFTPIDRSRDQTIQIPGTVDEILPHRQQEFFAMAQPDEKNTELTIVDPNRFWQDRYLVIVLD
jgi:uncharacterized coiled-coil protein SlyX